MCLKLWRLVPFRALSRHATDPIGSFAIKPVHYKLLILALQTEVAPAGKVVQVSRIRTLLSKEPLRLSVVWSASQTCAILCPTKNESPWLGNPASKISMKNALVARYRGSVRPLMPFSSIVLIISQTYQWRVHGLSKPPGHTTYPLVFL